MSQRQKLPWWEFDVERETVQECRERRLMQMPTLSAPQLEVLTQCQKATWDGDLVSKVARSELLRRGLLVKFNGWQVVSLEGLAILETLGALKERR